MKKKLMGLFLIVVLNVFGINKLFAQKTFYVYRSNGIVNQYVMEDVTSIEQSKIDIDGNSCEYYVTQIIHTKDSVSSLPISEIDSVSFIAPDPVKSISDAYVAINWETCKLIDCNPEKGKYIISYYDKDPNINDGSVIIVDNDSVSYIVLVTEVNKNGNIYELQGEQGDLSYIFSCTEFTLSTESERKEPTNKVNRIYRSPSTTLKEVTIDDDGTIRATGTLWKYGGDEIVKDIPTKWNNVHAYTKSKFGLNLDYSLSLIFGDKVKTKKQGCWFSKAKKFNADACIIGGMDAYWDFYVDIENEEEIIDLAPQHDDKYVLLKHKLFPNIPLRFSIGAVPIFIDLGTDLFADVSLKAKGEFHFTMGVGADAQTRLGVKYNGLDNEKLNIYYDKPSLTITPHDPTVSGKGFISGKLHVFPRIHAWLYGLAGPSLDLKPFFQADLSGGFKKDLLKNAPSDYCAWSLKTYSGLDVAVGLSASRMGYEEKNVSTDDFTLFQYNLYNSPVDLKFKKASPDIVKKGTKTDVQFEVYDRGFDGGKVLTPLPQLVKFEGDGEIKSTVDCFGVVSDGVVTASWTPNSDSDILYAKMYDIDGNVIAEAEYSKPTIGAKISDFVVNYSQCSHNGFTYKNTLYSYKFECTTTVQLDEEVDLSNVEDWGYVYEDPDGEVEHISLMGKDTPFPDNRYIYYRKVSKSTAILYGYVKYKNQDEYEYEKKHSFDLIHETCPDDLHPHMIDLGLSSGTLWCCSNFGANRPEEYGGYYAYAELSEKKNYLEQNYQYYYWDTMFDDMYSYYTTIGNNGEDVGVSISGKKGFDVVTEYWNEEGRMPTKDEIQELVDSCTWTWTFVDEIPGYEVMGPNGNSIFLPAAGAKAQGNNYAGEPNRLTYYRSGDWSDRQWTTKGYGWTWGILFKQDSYKVVNSCAKAFGYVIRPVKSKETE